MDSDRRAELVEKKYRSSLTEDEQLELDSLQKEFGKKQWRREPAIKLSFRPLYVIQCQWISFTLAGIVWDMHQQALALMLPCIVLTIRFKRHAKD